MEDYRNAAVIEAYEIVQTVQILLASGRTFRLEVVKNMTGTRIGEHHVDTYERQSLFKGPKGEISSTRMQSGIEFYVWVRDIDLPTNTYYRSTPEAAISMALALLTERRNNQNSQW